MNITISPYADQDLNAVAHAWYESWRSTGLAVTRRASEDTMRERIGRELASGWPLYLAADAAGSLVGFLALKLNTRCLDQIFVVPEAQRQGIGRELLNFAKQQMPDGFWLRTAVDNTGACRFYGRDGLTPGETATHATLGHETVLYDWS